jgi:hypothetical protein
MQQWSAQRPPAPAGAEADIAATAASLLVRIAAGLVLAAGLVVLLTGLQTTFLVTIRGPMGAAPYALFALGSATVVAATMVWRMRGWGAIAATVLCGLQALCATIWLFYSMMHGLFSFYAAVAPIASVVGLVFGVVAIGPCTRASAARARLVAAGLDFGI